MIIQIKKGFDKKMEDVRKKIPNVSKLVISNALDKKKQKIL